ncbi:MAG: DUF3842 family protein [Oscillospiraceae bacterium]|jgi:hypothetical protein|nr:DUF3842 family protein [Oscillospiraceae bacterium]
MRIAVIDGQGGGIGRLVVEAMRRELPADVEILALGTNAIATSLMLKAGADEGATGENAIVVNAGKADIIVGVTAIIAASSMLGELTPPMARAVAESPAVKLLIPLRRCNIEIVGVNGETPITAMIDMLILEIKEKLGASDS